MASRFAQTRRRYIGFTYSRRGLPFQLTHPVAISVTFLDDLTGAPIVAGQGLAIGGQGAAGPYAKIDLRRARVRYISS